MSPECKNTDLIESTPDFIFADKFRTYALEFIFLINWRL